MLTSKRKKLHRNSTVEQALLGPWTVHSTSPKGQSPSTDIAIAGMTQHIHIPESATDS